MKKTLAIILALTMVICMFAGCAAKTQTAPAENPTPSTEVEQKAAEQPASVVQADELVGQPCPLCGKGTVIKGKTAYGCSEWKSGCTFRKPF